MKHLPPLSSGKPILIRATGSRQGKINLPAVISKRLREPESRGDWTINLGARYFPLPKGTTILVGGSKNCDIYFPTMADKSTYLEITIDETGKIITPVPHLFECKISDQGSKYTIGISTWATTTSNHALSLATVSLVLTRTTLPVSPWLRSLPCSVSPYVPPAEPAEKAANIDELHLYFEQYCRQRRERIETKKSLPIIYRSLATGILISVLLYFGSASTAQTVLSGVLFVFFTGSFLNFYLSGTNWRVTEEALSSRLAEVDCESIAESLRVMERAERKIVLGRLEEYFPEKAFAVKAYLDAISKAILN